MNYNIFIKQLKNFEEKLNNESLYENNFQIYNQMITEFLKLAKEIFQDLTR